MRITNFHFPWPHLDADYRLKWVEIACLFTTGRRIQKRRPDSEWIGIENESLRVVSDKIFDCVQARLFSTREKQSAENKRGRPPRYLFSGILKCASCGGNYSVRNGKHYTCSSQSNGRDGLCEQRQYIRKDKVEVGLLDDIKRQLLDPEFVKEITKRIRALARHTPSTRTPASDLKKLDRQISDLAETICEVGRSDILTAKLKKLEAERQQKANVLDFSTRQTTPNLFEGAADQWTKIVSNLENLHKYAKPDEVESAREALKGIIGEVTIVEDGPHVVAYPKLNNNVGYNSGAQKRT